MVVSPPSPGASKHTPGGGPERGVHGKSPKPGLDQADSQALPDPVRSSCPWAFLIACQEPSDRWTWSDTSYRGFPPVPTQINHLSMYLQLNPSRNAETHRKAHFGWGVPAQGPSSQPSSTWADRRQGHTAPAESGGQHRPRAPWDTTANHGLLRDEASDLDGH